MKDLPQFKVYQPNSKEFHICLEAGSIYYCWWSYYPPSQDNRFARKVTRLRDISPKDIPRKQVYDQGTYTVNKGDNKGSAEKKLKNGIKNRSFSFILDGKKLKGRFIIKKTPGGTVIQKFKDKFVEEEDVFGGDLSRTISLMVPDYDPKKVKLNSTKEKKSSPRAEKVKLPEPEITIAEEEDITADKKIGKTSYHFTFYRSEDAPDLCLITNAKHEVLVLEQTRDTWKVLKAAGGVVLKKEKELIKHAAALQEQQ
ncbi:hypothetical protein U0035_00335 [Niabella yanshanensis]|uniref:Uncharacterized protein n=1 Tax=Niabella yanshanensis TaxID=577386 RepID=A0ABZ0W7X4_9BACT|nr:hypothetical protein [Niabella yanshanensis]WQD38592.1 hypothetical protein U0035_00335 [Niabella yanshanensis]